MQRKLSFASAAKGTSVEIAYLCSLAKGGTATKKGEIERRPARSVDRSNSVINAARRFARTALGPTVAPVVERNIIDVWNVVRNVPMIVAVVVCPLMKKMSRVEAKRAVTRNVRATTVMLMMTWMRLVVTKKMREANVIPMMTWMRVEVMKTVASNDDDDMEKEIIYELIDPNGTNKDDP
mmetsp:Transcript_2620/g.4855  ORF Transcript_2620/g.4855 Transcript_2620/m.4855 type:complete len:180 (+) Transcript_2620:178-717(+)